MNSLNQSFPLLLVHLLVLLFLLIISITLCPLSAHGCHDHERRALLNFKSSLEDPSNRLSSWQQSTQHRNCCDWHGIKCSDVSHHVVSIDLRNTKLEDYINIFGGYSGDFDPPSTALRGKLSPSLVSINHLEYLDLAFNDFQESKTPLRFSKLTKLTHLDLSTTNFSAPISKHFTNVSSSLQYLDLSCETINNHYTTSCIQLPSTEWMRHLSNLQVLRLSGIDLFEATSPSKGNFFQHVSHLWNLRDLDISDCSIDSPVFPIQEFHNLSRLSSLKMNRNYYLNSSIPWQLVHLTSLSILEAAGCQLHGSIPYLPRLKELDVSYNKYLQTDLTRIFEHHWPRLRKLWISGTNASGSSIPSSVSNAPLLVFLSARGCSIQGSFSIYNLSRLQYLDLFGNQITASIHSLISNLKYLKFLDLSSNNVQGPIPESICENVSLQHLGLALNNITGTIPSCITSLRNLRFVDVSQNSITGELSLISLINELNLVWLDLSSNKFTVVVDQHLLYPSKCKLSHLGLKSCNMEGFIPSFICNFTRLEDLDLSYNNLTGTIPSCISKLKKLDRLYLSNNRLRGHLPLLPQPVGIIDLSHNKLSGGISMEIGESLSGSGYFDLNNNELSGPIPSSLCSQKQGMPSTTSISLSNNKLSGIIPANIGNCIFLSALSLDNNSLTGNVPDELQHTTLRYLNLSDNNLNGTFPKSILSLLGLGFLNLGSNNFEGIIPADLGSLNDLKFLLLRSNRFNGSIPEEIFHLQNLQILDLSLNNLTGPLPLKLGNLTRLATRSSQIFATRAAGVQYMLANKGTRTQFEYFDLSSSGIDLSCNILNGSIPNEIGLLQGLAMLNLSYNRFSTIIPATIGNMSSLESLDLSSNRLSGPIPQSLASIDSLEVLNLSNNNLSGRIPRENHFDTLSVNGAAFVGNALLCGYPLSKVCDGDQSITTSDTYPSSKVDEDDPEDGKEKLLLYAIVAMGFAVGFWGLFLVLLLRRHKWWFPYWRFVGFVAVRIVECIHKKQQ